MENGATETVWRKRRFPWLPRAVFRAVQGLDVRIQYFHSSKTNAYIQFIQGWLSSSYQISCLTSALLAIPTEN